MAKGKGKKNKGAQNQDPNNRVVASNRRARHDFEIIDKFECGMVLVGSEVKSLREANVRIAESYARVQRNELWLHSLHVAPYSHAGAAFQHDPDRRKKLLANRHEIERMEQATDADGLTLVPLSLYFKGGRAKIEIGIARRKKSEDKRRDIASRDATREADRAMSRNRTGKSTYD